MSNKIIAACGNDCASCPRYNKSNEELKATAELWYKIGYRDCVVSPEEISCSGCTTDNWCRYNVVKCVKDKNIDNCGQCSMYPCDNIRECFQVTLSFEPACKANCTPEEYEIIRKAFFEKERNLTP